MTGGLLCVMLCAKTGRISEVSVPHWYRCQSPLVSIEVQPNCQDSLLPLNQQMQVNFDQFLIHGKSRFSRSVVPCKLNADIVSGFTDVQPSTSTLTFLQFVQRKIFILISVQLRGRLERHFGWQLLFLLWVVQHLMKGLSHCSMTA